MKRGEKVPRRLQKTFGDQGRYCQENTEGMLILDHKEQVLGEPVRQLTPLPVLNIIAARIAPKLALYEETTKLQLSARFIHPATVDRPQARLNRIAELT